jgi:hypothetical protein
MRLEEVEEVEETPGFVVLCTYLGTVSFFFHPDVRTVFLSSCVRTVCVRTVLPQQHICLYVIAPPSQLMA